MKTNAMLRLLGLFGLIAFFVSACTAPATSLPPVAVPATSAPLAAYVEPTAVPPTAVPATAFPATPTNTAAPPTNTSTPTVTHTSTSTATSLPASATPTQIQPSPTASRTATALPITTAAVIQAALAKNRVLKAYRGLITFWIGQAQLLDWQGEVHEPSAHFNFISDWYSTDREIIAVGDKMYHREYNYNSKSYTGAWTPEPREQTLLYVQSPRNVVQDLVGNPASYRKTGAVTLGGMQCTKYEHQNKTDIVRAYVTASSNMGNSFAGWTTTTEDRGAVNAQVVVCPDGYLHFVMLELDPGANSYLQKITLGAGLGAPNADIQIKAP